MRIVSPTQIKLDQGDLCSLAAAGAAGVQLENAIGSLDLPGLQETARAALLEHPEVLRAYRVGESRWKAEIEREMTLRIHEPRRGSMASNGLMMFALRSRLGYRPAGDETTSNTAPVILVASNKLAKVQEAKQAAKSAVATKEGGVHVEVKVEEAGGLPVVEGVPIVERPEGKAQKGAAQRGRKSEVGKEEKFPWE